MLYEALSGKIIQSCYKVHSSLGSGAGRKLSVFCSPMHPGFWELPYHNALYNELKKQGLSVGYGVPFKVLYEGETVGEYFADLVVQDAAGGSVLVEVKSVQSFTNEHYAQVLNNMHISGIEVGLLVNFRPVSVQLKRLVLPRGTGGGPGG